MKIYVVTYSSEIYGELYHETKLATTKENAQYFFDGYVDGIAEDFGNDEDIVAELNEYKGTNFLDYGSIFDARNYYVTWREEEMLSDK